MEVDASLGEQSLELLLGEKVTRLGKEGVEWHADGARDVTRFCVCGCERENTIILISKYFLFTVFCSKLMSGFYRSGSLLCWLPAWKGTASVGGLTLAHLEHLETWHRFIVSTIKTTNKNIKRRSETRALLIQLQLGIICPASHKH